MPDDQQTYRIPPGTRPTLAAILKPLQDRQFLEGLLTHLVRCQDVARLARDNFAPPDSFCPEEPVYDAIWKAVHRFYAPYGNVSSHVPVDALPTFAYLLATAKYLLPRTDDVAEAVARTELILRRIFENPTERYDPQSGIALLQQLLVGRSVQAQIQQLVASPIVGVNADSFDLGDLVASTETAVRTRVGRAPPPESSLFDLVPASPRKPDATGLSILDAWTKGGFAPGEVCVLQGPNGADIGRLAMRILMSSVQRQPLQQGSGGGGKVHIYFGYLEGAEAMRSSAAACIDQVGTDQPGSPGTGLSRFDQYIRFLDFSTGYIPEYGLCCTGGICEIADWVDGCQRDANLPVGLVVIAAALPVVDRYIMRLGGKADEIRPQHLATFVQRVRSQVAVPFGCSAPVLHETASHRQSTAAAYCPNFVACADFALVMSPKDRTGRCSLECTKARSRLTDNCCTIDARGELVPMSRGWGGRGGSARKPK